MGKTHVVRRLAYWYTDEFYRTDASTAAIVGAYDDESAARTALARLEAAKVRSVDFSREEPTCLFWPIDKRTAEQEARLQRFQAYCKAAFGYALLTPRGGDGRLAADEHTTLPADATDDEVMQIREILGLAYHAISVFEAEPVFYGIWLVPDAAYLEEFESSGTWFFDSYDDALARIDDVRGPVDRFEVRGTLEELSAQPLLLRSALDQCRDISYDATTSTLCLYNVCGRDIRLINPLLRQPLFEIRPVPLDEAMRLRPATWR